MPNGDGKHFLDDQPADDGDTLVGFQAVTNERLPTMTKPKAKIDDFVDSHTSAAALMHRGQLFHAASAEINGQREAKMQTWSFEEACVMLNTAINTLAINQAAFLREKAGKPNTGDETSIINRDDTFAHLLIAYGRYLMVRPEVK